MEQCVAAGSIVEEPSLPTLSDGTAGECNQEAGCCAQPLLQDCATVGSVCMAAGRMLLIVKPAMT